MNYSIESENSVIGALLLDNSSYDRVVDILQPNMFFNPAYAEVYRTIGQFIDANKPADILTISEAMDRSVISLGELTTLAQNTPSAANIARYAHIVKAKWQARQTMQVISDISENLEHASADEIESVLLDASKSIEELTAENTDDRTEDNNEVMSYGVKRILARQEGELSGIPTGFTELDNRIQGFNSGDLIIIAGRPSMGKTATALSFVNNISLGFVEQNKWVLFFSMEMDKGAIADRQLSSQSGVSLNNILSGKLNDTDYNKVTNAAHTQRNIVTDFRGNLSVGQIRAKARRVNHKTPVGLIVIDYLQLMKTGKAENQNIAISEITRNLKALAKEMGIPVVVLSQLNRGVEQRTNKRPVMSDLRDSGAIEQDADMIFMLYREEYYNKESMNKGVIEIVTSKNRNGETGSDHLAFRGECVRVDNLSNDWRYYEEEPQKPTSKSKGFKLGATA